MATDDLREAMATVLEYWGHKFVDPDKYENACELLARYLAKHAGRLRVVLDCELCGGDGMFGDSECAMCDGNGYAMEPIFGEGGK